MTPDSSAPGLIGRIRSKQAGHPSGLLGRIIGRVMVKDTADANDRAVDLLELKSSQTILEIGFGQGRTAAILAEAGHQLLGVEVSSTMLHQATARNRKACHTGQVKLAQGDGIRIPFDDNSADVAFMTHAIYFMADPQETLCHVARVLRPGGRLVVATRVSDDPIPAWIDPNIYRIPSRQELTEMLRVAGFDSIVEHGGDKSGHQVYWFVAETEVARVEI
jgi:SAM-dependent methyltransferase